MKISNYCLLLHITQPLNEERRSEIEYRKRKKIKVQNCRETLFLSSIELGSHAPTSSHVILGTTKSMWGGIPRKKAFYFRIICEELHLTIFTKLILWKKNPCFIVELCSTGGISSNLSLLLYSGLYSFCDIRQVRTKVTTVGNGKCC